MQERHEQERLELLRAKQRLREEQTQKRLHQLNIRCLKFLLFRSLRRWKRALQDVHRNMRTAVLFFLRRPLHTWRERRLRALRESEERKRFFIAVKRKLPNIPSVSFGVASSKQHDLGKRRRLSDISSTPRTPVPISRFSKRSVSVLAKAAKYVDASESNVALQLVVATPKSSITSIFMETRDWLLSRLGKPGSCSSSASDSNQVCRFSEQIHDERVMTTALVHTTDGDISTAAKGLSSADALQGTSLIILLMNAVAWVDPEGNLVIPEARSAALVQDESCLERIISGLDPRHPVPLLLLCCIRRQSHFGGRRIQWEAAAHRLVNSFRVSDAMISETSILPVFLDDYDESDACLLTGLIAVAPTIPSPPKLFSCSPCSLASAVVRSVCAVEPVKIKYISKWIEWFNRGICGVVDILTCAQLFKLSWPPTLLSDAVDPFLPQHWNDRAALDPLRFTLEQFILPQFAVSWDEAPSWNEQVTAFQQYMSTVQASKRTCAQLYQKCSGLLRGSRLRLNLLSTLFHDLFQLHSQELQYALRQHPNVCFSLVPPDRFISQFKLSIAEDVPQFRRRIPFPRPISSGSKISAVHTSLQSPVEAGVPSNAERKRVVTASQPATKNRVNRDELLQRLEQGVREQLVVSESQALALRDSSSSSPAHPQ